MEDSELPLLLPELDDFTPGTDPQGPLSRALDWRFFQRDGKWFARETNTMPQWAGSCWYYLRYLDPNNDEAAFSESAYRDWMPVDLYVGGSEHAVLHLLYARFWHKVLFDVGVVKDPEPFIKLMHQGMILGQTYRYFAAPDDAGGAAYGVDRVTPGADKGVFVSDDGVIVEPRFEATEVEVRDGKPYHATLGVLMDAINEKMSKSRGNVVNPDDVIDEYGADCLRIYEMFMGPLERTKPWQMQGMVGVRNFLEKAFAVCTGKVAATVASGETQKLMHRMIKKVAHDIEALRPNTTVSEMMKFANHLKSLSEVPKDAAEALTSCLAPFAPHLAEEMWEALGPHGGRGEATFRGETGCVALSQWPPWDEALCVDDVVEVPIQVNGKVRGRVSLPVDADEAAAREAALADPQVQTFLGGKDIAKMVYVPGRILNLILRK
jgi:leucyl-tRNA synthetase